MKMAIEAAKLSRRVSALNLVIGEVSCWWDCVEKVGVADEFALDAKE